MIIRYTPNTLCILRIFCAPLFLMSFSKGFKDISILILSMGAISDFLDGYIARKFNVQSKLGELLDPLADKIFSNFVLWSIYFYGSIPNQITVLILALFLTIRDIILLSGSFYIISKKLKVKTTPTYLSKVCTTLLFFTCFLSISFNSSSKIVLFLWIICIILITTTSYIYIKRFFLKKTASR